MLHMSTLLESTLVETEAFGKQSVKIIFGFSKLRTVRLYASSEVINWRDIQTCSSINQLACYVIISQILLFDTMTYLTIISEIPIFRLLIILS